MRKIWFCELIVCLIVAVIGLSCPPPLRYFHLTAVVNPIGSGTTDLNPAGNSYQPGTSVQLTANANSDWQFSHWEGNVADTNANPTTIVMNGNQTVTVTFIKAMAELVVTPVTLPCGLPATILDEAGSFRSDTAIAVDSNDKVHLVYRLSAADRDYYHALAYANNVTGSWRMKKNWQTEAFGTYSAIAVDSHNKVHICTTGGHGAGENLVYFTNQTGDWTEAVVDTGLSVGLENDISLDQNDKVHLSYWQWNGDNLCYATNTNGDWVISIICNVIWQPTSIVLDSQQNVWVATMRKLASQSGDNWQVETILLGDEGNGPVAIIGGATTIIDGSDNFYHLTRYGLAVKTNGGWTSQDIFAEMLPDLNHDYLLLDEDALALDSQGNLHLTFLAALGFGNNPAPKEHRLYYATNVSGQWQTVLIDYWLANWRTTEEAVFPPGLAVDSQNNVHLVYVKTEPDDYHVYYCTFDPVAFLSSQQ